MNTAAVVGGAVSGVFLLALVVAAMLYFHRRYFSSLPLSFHKAAAARSLPRGAAGLCWFSAGRDNVSTADGALQPGPRSRVEVSKREVEMPHPCLPAAAELPTWQRSRAMLSSGAGAQMGTQDPSWLQFGVLDGEGGPGESLMLWRLQIQLSRCYFRKRNLRARQSENDVYYSKSGE